MPVGRDGEGTGFIVEKFSFKLTRMAFSMTTWEKLIMWILIAVEIEARCVTGFLWTMVEGFMTRKFGDKNVLWIRKDLLRGLGRGKGLKIKEKFEEILRKLDGKFGKSSRKSREIKMKNQELSSIGCPYLLFKQEISLFQLTYFIFFTFFHWNVKECSFILR